MGPPLTTIILGDMCTTIPAGTCITTPGATTTGITIGAIIEIGTDDRRAINPVRRFTAEKGGGTMETQNAISVLNDLIETCFDSQRGFKEAADNTTDTTIKSVFSEASRERGRYANSLMREVRDLGGAAESHASAGIGLHRLWANIIGSLAGRNDQSLLAEAERGESSAISAYEEALDKELPAYIHSLLEAQCASMRRNRDLIKSLRIAARAAGATR